MTQAESDISLRPATLADVDACAKICYDAFAGINAAHGFPPDIPQLEMAQGFMRAMLANPSVVGVVAEQGGRIVGSNFLWGGAIGGIGPITVDGTIQEQGIGRRLMEHVIHAGDEMRLPGIRLVQAGFNMRSLSLYTKLGFDIREPLAVMNGPAIGMKFTGYNVRPMTDLDVDECCALCTRIHGHDRRGELIGAIAQGTATVVTQDGRITGYSTDVGFFAHTVAQHDIDLLALISAARKFSGPGFLLPMRQSEIFRWCLAHGLRVVEPMNLMSRGLYNDPKGAFLPSVLF